MSVILDVSYTLCIWISAGVAIIYTLLGGLYSVAYTDIIQLTLIFFSLVSSNSDILLVFKACFVFKNGCTEIKAGFSVEEQNVLSLIISHEKLNVSWCAAKPQGICSSPVDSV